MQTLRTPDGLPLHLARWDAAAAARGKTVFEGAGTCSGCHSGTLFTDANTTLHPPSDSMAEPTTTKPGSRLRNDSRKWTFAAALR